MRTALEQANDKMAITPLSIAETCRVKLLTRKSMIKSSIETMEQELFKARIEAKICIAQCDTTLTVLANGGWLLITQHNAEQIRDGFTSIEELVLDNVPFKTFVESPGPLDKKVPDIEKIQKGDVLFHVAKNGMLKFVYGNYDTTDSGRYNVNKF